MVKEQPNPPFPLSSTYLLNNLGYFRNDAQLPKWARKFKAEPNFLSLFQTKFSFFLKLGVRHSACSWWLCGCTELRLHLITQARFHGTRRITGKPEETESLLVGGQFGN
jgi:hypothetical protein